MGNATSSSMIAIITATSITLCATYRGRCHNRRIEAEKKRQAKEQERNIRLATTRANEPRQSVTVRVPATSANLGPGYDTLGMAVDIWNEVTASRAASFSLTNEGEGANILPVDESNLVVVGLKAAFQAAGQDLPVLAIHCKNRIPFARGLGSSSAGIVAGIIAGLVLSGHELNVHGKEELLQLAADIEGHPDNVAPAIYGSVQLGIYAEDRWHSSRIQIHDGLVLVLFIPDTTGATSTARAILSREVSREDAVFNISRTAMLVNALVSNHLDDLKYATADRLHQPARGQHQYPHLKPMIEAALDAGAHGCYLSGAGPTVCAITSGRAGDIFTQRAQERQERRVGDAMRLAAAQAKVSGSVFITQPDHRGAHVVHAEPRFSDPSVARYERDLRNL